MKMSTIIFRKTEKRGVSDKKGCEGNNGKENASKSRL